MEDSYPEPVDRSSGKITVRAVVTRKDGTVEDLGIISEGEVDFKASSGSS